MKIFLSYGNDANASLVERIARDLEAAGHRTWIDKAQIKAGDDWRRSIVDGLAQTDWVLAFLSKHAIRDPGVCLDELAIALHTKGGAIATVLLEGEAAAAPPVSASHIQWLDMHDWAERQAKGGPEWEVWYRSKIDELLALLAEPATHRFAGEIAELDRRLGPVSQEGDIGLLVDGFVGREWLRATLDDWRRTAGDSRLFWLSGAAGTGKSAFAAWLAHRGRVNVIGINLCRYNLDDRTEAGSVIRTLIFQIATRVADYRRLLLDRLRAQAPDGSDTARKSPADLFEQLLVEPLRLAIDGGRRADRYLVVIDGLDETVRDGESALADILAEQANKLPAWIALVVTSRPEEPILGKFSRWKPHQIEAEAPENLADLHAYVNEWLSHLGDLPPGETAASLAQRMVAASGGNFLYLRMLREAVTGGMLSLAAPEGMPQGLVGLYRDWFKRRFPDAAVYETYMPLLAVLAAAEHPVPEAWLKWLFGWSKRDAARRLEGLGSLFERRAEGVAPFHKSLRDWLVDPHAAGADYVVDETEGTRLLAAALWSEFARWAQAPATALLDPFCVIELPAQLARTSPDELHRLLAQAGGWPSIQSRLVQMAEGGATWESMLAWCRTLAAIAAASGEEAWVSRALTWAGDFLMCLGRSAAALKSYRDGLAVRERLVQTDPGNADWQYELGISNERVGIVLMEQGNLPTALQSFRDRLAIGQRLAHADPGNAGWQRDLSVCYEKVGDVLVALGNLAEALQSYRDAVAIRERLAQTDPGNAEWQRDLSVSYEKVGDVLVALGNLRAALQSCRDGLAIRERLEQADPGHAGWQRDLSASYEKVGDVLVALGSLPAALAALQFYRNGLAIRERLAQADPGNVGWQRDLSVSHAKLAVALQRAGQQQEAPAP